MAVEKPRSIMCEICGGWHATEAHTQYEKEASEKRIAETKARPDSAYLFETLGFTPEQKGTVEPWMHAVIERAKELGDDLQDSNNFIHMQLRNPDETKDRLLEIVSAGFFQLHPLRRHHGRSIETELVKGGRLYARPHNAGTKFEKWGQSDLTKAILNQQERYLITKDSKDLEEYKRLITKALKIEGTENTLLETTVERRRVVERLVGRNFGIILAFSEKINNDSDLSIQRDSRPAFSFMMQIRDRVTGKLLIEYPDLLSVEFEDSYVSNEPIYDPKTREMTYFSSIPPEDIVQRTYAKRSPETTIDFYGKDLERVDPKVLKRLSFYILSGIYVAGGVKEQKIILEQMLQSTMNHPEHRLPIYNFYGKLVWPRPPKEK